MYNVYIRPLEQEDSKTSWLWRNDTQVWKFTGNRPDKEITYEIEKEWINTVLKDSSSKRFSIIVDDVYVGNIQLTNLTDESAQYHIFIGNKEYWGKGIGQLATFQILNYAKEILNLKEVYLHVNSDNLSAITVYEKNGFERKNHSDTGLKMVCVLEKRPNPTVSIFCMVYNHEKFITECLNGFLMQKCNFNYLVVLGEDCSTDNSRNIILDFNEKYPGKFKLLLHDQNIGANKNQELVLKNCTGKYIALCEGDDYWTDPTKLQQQFDFMEQHPDYIMCCHDRNVVDEQNNILIKNQQTTKVDKDTFVQTLFYRNISFDDLFYTYFEQAKNGDTFLIYRLHQLGKTHYFDFNGACYRVSDAGVWSKVSDEKRFEMSISSLDNMIAYYTMLNDKKTVNEIQKWKAEQFLIKSKSLSEAGYKSSAVKHIFKYNALLLATNPRLFFSANNLKTTTFLTTKFLLQ